MYDSWCLSLCFRKDDIDEILCRGHHLYGLEIIQDHCGRPPSNRSDELVTSTTDFKKVIMFDELL